MQVYKTFLKISIRNIGQILVYLGIFIVLLLVTASMSSSGQDMGYSNDHIDVCVVDNDHSKLSESLYGYISGNHDIVDAGSDEEAWKDAIFYHVTEYVLVIPKGFEENFKSGSEKESELLSYKLPDSNSAYIVEMQTESYLNNLRVLLDNKNIDYDTALKRAGEISGLSSSVNFLNETGSVSSISRVSLFYSFLPYILLCVMICSAGPIIIVWNRTEIKKRNAISATSHRVRSAGVIGAVITLALCIYALIVVIGSVMYGSEVTGNVGFYYALNAFVYMLVCVAVAYLIAQFAKSVNMLSIWSNVIGLSTSFLCGVFVGRELLPKGVVAFSKILPTYWYINVTEELKGFNGTLSMQCIYSMLIQLMFAFVLFAGGIIAAKYRNEKI